MDENKGAIKVPRHVAVVLDGNRRFAKRLMLKPYMGHEWGAKKVENLLDWCKELGVSELTLYTFSLENFNRPKEEFNFLMDIFAKEFGKLLTDSRLDSEQIKVNFIGRIFMFPSKVQGIMQQLMDKTKSHAQFTINFAMAYGGRAEVIDAVKKVGEQIQNGSLDISAINEEVFSQNLYMHDEPDLIIRTGGEHRTSNFLIWQSHYSEWVFLEKMWPEFDKADFMQCVAEYSKRERRFGR